jgi:hypothetical protein
MVGAGPSLTPEMLNAIKDEKSFAMNNISVIYPDTDWRPTYYINVARTTNLDKHWAKCAVESISVAKHNFLWVSNIWLIEKMLQEEASVSLLSCASFPQWSWTPFDWVSRWGSSMFAALQIAVFLGFNPIFLLGCDLNYVNSIDPETHYDTGHFSNDYLGDYKKKWMLNNITDSLQLDELRTYISHQITHMNTLSRGIWVISCLKGRLNAIYPYRSLEDVLDSPD